MSEAPVKPAAPVKRRPAKPAPRPRPETKDKPKTDQPKQWNVVLLDDDDHSYEYVVAMVQELFSPNRPRRRSRSPRPWTRGDAPSA